MLKYFIKRKDDINYPIKKYPRMDWIVRKYQFELEKVKNYYRFRERTINNKNLLARLIDLLKTDLYKDEFEYYRYVDLNAPYILKQLGIVNDLNKGKTLESVIYGDNSYEIFLSIEKDIDFDYIRENWKEIESIRMIYTEKTELNFRVPFEDVNFYIPQLHIFEIDVVTLMLQYRYWALDRLANDNSTDPNVFLPTIIYPNILNNETDLILFNRYCNKALGEELYTELDNHNPFLIINYMDKVDSIMDKVVLDTKNRNIYLTQLLETIPTIYNKDMIDALHINKDIFNTYTYWVLVVSRMKIILKLLKILDKHGLKRNKDLINRLPVEIKEIERRTQYQEGMLPILFDIDLQETIEEISNIVGRR